MMAYLGAKQKNTVWSWCAVDEEDRKVYFSLWSDFVSKDAEGRARYVVQEPHWGVDPVTNRKSAARNDHDGKLALVFNEGYQSYGYIVVAKDRNAEPREIEETRTGFVFELNLSRADNGVIYGAVMARINLR
jgi:hypothetical protein